MTGVDRGILRAVGRGHGRISCTDCGAELLINGLHPCDQIAARRVLDNRLVAPKIPGRPGMTVLAVLTDAGQRELDGTAVLR